MSVMDSLIFDRSSTDLMNDTDRCYISCTDLNRVEQACEYLAGILGVAIKTKVWKMEDWRTGTEMERIRQNIAKLKEAYFVRESTPAIPVEITYTSIYLANNIEKILKDIGDMYDSMVSGIPRLSFGLGKQVLGNRR